MRTFPAVPSTRNSVTAQDMQKAATAFTESLPEWIKDASKANIYKLRVLIASHRTSQIAVAGATKAAVPLQAFAESKFSEALAGMLPSGQTLNGLQWRRKTRRPVGHSVPHLEDAFEVQPALSRLVQNFAEGDIPFSGSGLVVQVDDDGVIGNTAQLIEACRLLDAGKQYQALLDQHFTQNKPLLVADKLAGFKLAVHVAFLKGKIDNDVRDALERYAESPSGTATEPRLTAYPGLMSMLGVLVHEALIIQLKNADGKSAGVVTYMPGDADNPLRWHSSTHELQAEMVSALQHQGYQRELLQLIALDARNGFFQQLQLRLMDDVPDLQIEGMTGHGTVFTRWVDEQVERVRADAKVLLVPTADADAEASRKRLEDWKSLGWGLVGLAGFFIPAVGAVLLGALLKDVCAQVFEGVTDWAKGHDHEALQHALNVAQVVVATGAAVVAGAAVGRLVDRALEEGLEAVTLDDDSQGLWSGDLSIYQRELPDDAVMGADGLYFKGNRRWLRVDEHYYEVHQPSENGAWRLLHPDRPHAYGPVLQRNAERLWLLPDDSPMDWNEPQQMLARLWPQQSPLDQLRAKQVLQAACSDIDELRGILVENRPLPANLRDTLRRFEADERIERFFRSLAPGATGADDLALLDWCEQRLDLAQLTAAERHGAILDRQIQLRQDLFDHLTFVEPGSDLVVQVLKRDFTGLPTDYAIELACQVSGDEREEVQLLQRLPLSVSTKARSLLQLARLNHAVQGVMLRNAYSDDSDELALGLLSRLDHWSFSSRLEIRLGSAEGRVLAAINTQASEGAPITMVRHAGAFRLYDAQGLMLEEQSSVPDDFFQAIASVLTAAQKTALGLGSEDQAGELRRQVVKKLPIGRQKLVHQLAWQEQPGWFNPGQQLDDGRVGYPLGGSVSQLRGPGWRVRRRLARLYQGDSPRQIDEHLNRILDAANPYAALVLEEQNYQMLDHCLGTWIADGPGGERAARRLLGQRLLQAWRRQLPIDVHGNALRGFVLDLSGHGVSSLPQLNPAIDFHHVTSLVMVNTPLQVVPDAFLSCFRHVRRLNMARNRLEALPVGIRHLRGLERLDLSYNGIRNGERVSEALSTLTELQELDLSANPAIRSLYLSNWAAGLRRLHLKECGLLEWPEGLERCRLLRWIDLRSNNLINVPAAIQAMPYSYRISILLDRNAIEGAQLERLYARPVHIHPPAAQPAPELLAARDVWVTGEHAQARGETWDRLFAKPRRSQLDTILGRLQQSSDYSNKALRSELDARVWTMLDAMDTDTELANNVHAYVRGTTCIDDVADLFSELHLLVLVENATRSSAEAGQQQALLELGQGLFRLTLLKEHIGRYIAEKTVSKPNLDAIEVSLYFRLALAEEMKLPSQPSSMMFGAIANVSEADLDAARAFVREAATVEAKAAFLSQQTFWCEWVEKQHAEAFAPLLDQFQDSLAEVFEQRDEMHDEPYWEQSNELSRQHAQNKTRLVILLTKPMLTPDADPILPAGDQTGHPD